MRHLVTVALLTLLAAPTGQAVAADKVDLQLILAADVSRSVDPDEFHLQREGYASAFTDPKVLNAIQSGPNHAIAVTFVEWSGSEAQHVVAAWTVIRDEETASDFVATLRTAQRSFAGFTSISAAIDFSMKLFETSGVESDRRMIDVSGDGTNNGGRPVNDARDEAVAQGVTINGLAIINQHPNPGYTAHTQPPEGLGEYYRQNVTGGPGSFVIVIEDFTTFGEAIVNKLVTEIANTGRKRPVAEYRGFKAVEERSRSSPRARVAG